MCWPMGVLLSRESCCAPSFVRRCAIGRNLARPVVIDVSAASASQLACCRAGNVARCRPLVFKRIRSVHIYFKISLPTRQSLASFICTA